MTLNAAANKYNIPSSTIHPYVRKAKSRLGRILPPQANIPIAYTDIISSQPLKQKPPVVVRVRGELLYYPTTNVAKMLDHLPKVIAKMLF